MNKVEKIKAEIEKRKQELRPTNTHKMQVGEMDRDVLMWLNALTWVKNLIDSLEEEPISEDLEEAAIEAFKQIVDSDKNNFLEIFKAGAQWQKERILNNAIEREVKVDAGGYPYIDVTELYDYDRDKPIAKEGDRVKLIIIMEE